jgi:hypothetical protein
MKKVKMMLLSLALFAVVGAALAFKAKFQIDYCTTNVDVTADNTGIFCPVHVVSKPTIDPQAPFVATTTYANNCVGLKCTTTSTRLTPDTP